jgi:hypothetical protein
VQSNSSETCAWAANVSVGGQYKGNEKEQRKEGPKVALGDLRLSEGGLDFADTLENTKYTSEKSTQPRKRGLKRLRVRGFGRTRIRGKIRSGDTDTMTLAGIPEGEATDHRSQHIPRQRDGVNQNGSLGSVVELLCVTSWLRGTTYSVSALVGNGYSKYATAICSIIADFVQSLPRKQWAPQD